MSSGAPDLFVVCKSCGAEVSPYITECPYCGKPLRKRAPKLDRNLQVTERERERIPRPSLGRLRRGEMPGIRHDARPRATLLLSLAAIIGTLLFRTGLVNAGHLVVFGGLHYEFWRVFVAPFVYLNTGYAFVGIGVIALFGFLLEQRHGPIVVLVLFLLGGVGGIAVGAETTSGVITGGNGAAIALITAWAIPDVLALRRDEAIDGDVLGAVVLAVVVALMPLAAQNASWAADAVGLAAGLLVGLPIARARPTA